MRQKMRLPETGGISAMAQTMWGRMYILVAALNVVWFFCAQFFMFQLGIAEDILDWLLISVLIIMPSSFVFGRAFVVGNARLGVPSVFVLLAVASVLWVLSEAQVIFSDYYFLEFDSDRTVFTVTGPIFAVVYAAASRFANPALKHEIVPKQKRKTKTVSPSVWGGIWRHVAAFVLALLLSNFAQRLVAASFDQYFFGSVDLPSKEEDVMLSAFSAATLLFIFQTVFFGLVYKLFGRIHPVRAIPAIVTISMLGVWSTYGNVYALSIVNGDNTEAASGFGFSWAAMQALSAIAFLTCFYFMFRNRRVEAAPDERVVQKIAIDVPQQKLMSKTNSLQPEQGRELDEAFSTPPLSKSAAIPGTETDVDNYDRDSYEGSGSKDQEETSPAGYGLEAESLQSGGPANIDVPEQKMAATSGLKKANRWSDPDELTYLPTVVCGAAGGVAALGLDLGGMVPVVAYASSMAVAQIFFATKFLRERIAVHWAFATVFAITGAIVSVAL
jgi:hypothetical protein